MLNYLTLNYIKITVYYIRLYHSIVLYHAVILYYYITFYYYYDYSFIIIIISISCKHLCD